MRVKTATVFDGSVEVEGHDVTRMSPKDKLARAGVADILQGNSVFPDLSV